MGQAGRIPRGELRARLAALRAKFGGGGGSIQETVRGVAPASAGRPVPPPPAQAGPTNADDLPTPGDLAASNVVLLTAEIRALAAALGGRPTDLYNWVATQIEWVPYVGQMQNSQAVLWSRRGNDFDQATLLIALLRASNIPARYVCVDAAMPRADIREWLGLKDESIMLGLLSRGLDFSLFPSVGQDSAVATRVWVEAYLTTSTGKAWCVMDPARKRRSFQPGIVLPQPPYDRTAYLRAFQPVLPSEPYFDAMRADLQKRYPGRGFNEVPYTGTLLAPPPASTEAPYPVVKLQFRSSEVPTALRHKVTLSLTEFGKQSRFLSVELSLPEISLNSLSLTYTPATAADRQVVEAFGGLESAPAAVVNLLPEIRMAGPVIASGKTPIPMGTVMDLQVIHTPAAQSTLPYVSNNRHTAGETAAVVLGAHQIGEALLTSRIASLLERLPVAPAAEATRRLLDVAGLRYLHRLGMETKRLGDFLQVRFIQATSVENAITFASLDPQNLFDRPFVVTPGRLRIHADPSHLPLVDLNRSDQNDPVLKVAWQLHNDAASALEHEIWEETILVPAASTIKILQTAIRDGIPIHSVDRKNAATELPKIQGTTSAKATMQERISKGATLTVPGRPVTIGSWKGQGWIEEYDDGWSYAYIIEVDSPAGGEAPGGDTGGTPPPPRPPQGDPGTVGDPQQTHNITCSDPVNVANGNLFEQVTDYTLATQGSSIIFQRTYNSLNLADGPLGPGWRHSYQVSLKESASGIVVQDGSGSTLTFRLVSGAYVSPPGYYLTLTKDAQGQGYLLRTKHGVESRFDARGALQGITDRNRNSLQLSYDADRLSRVTDRAGRGVTLSYDGRGRLITLADFAGRQVTYEYDAAGRLAAVTDRGRNRTQYAYYTDRVFNHLLKSVTTPQGNVTAWEYYGNGRVSRVINPDGRTMNFLYLPLRNETHVIDAQGRLTSFQYNSLGNVVRQILPDGSHIERVYNAQARLESQTDAAGYTARFTHDAAGNLTSVTDPLGRTTRYTYDPSFNLVTSIRDAAGNMTQFEYDARGNLTRAVKPLGVETRFTWDGAGNMTSATDAEGNTSTFSYDQLGNLTEVRDALGNVTKFEFDQLSRRTRTVDPLGGEMRREYDALDRVVKLHDQLGRAASMAHDRDGRLGQTIDFAGRVTRFYYDPMNYLIQVADAMGQLTRYVYTTPDCGCTSTGNLTLFRDAAGTARSQAYDPRSRLISTIDALENKTQYAYDARGNLVRKVDPNGNVTSFEYDAAGQLTRKAFSDGTDVRFSYDAVGNLLSAGNQYVWLTYTYDELNRLTGAQHENAPAEAYSYDPAGNRKSSAADPDWRYDATGRLVAAEGATFTYDKNGNLVSRSTASGTTKYAWDLENRLVRVDLPDGGVVTYRYDPFGRRIEKNVNGAVTAYLYDGNAILLEMDIGGQMKARYTHGAQIDWPLLMEREGQTFFYHADALGSVAALTDSSGNVVRSYMYDSWGRPQGTEATGPDNPFQFAGREYDLETGLYYVRARYYDPAVGRFISADPLDLPGLVVTAQSPGHEEALLPQAAAWVLRGRSLGLVRGFRSAAERAPQKLNAYAYALNNPLAVADPSGLRPAGVCEGAVVGAAPPSHDWRIEEQLEALEAEWESAPWWQKLWDWLKPRHPGWVAPEGMQGIQGETGSEA